ncbi:FAD-dependent oxidoreductase [Desemzia sp. C1]|uniref:NADPH-dependent 2,4-dienoyl-CoA reductase, sulfur reductase n=1 Tax=Marinilactibacillus piezotolerans TaxID=258723 RepID=A0A1I3WW57_9LACT|nr:MULTISPECIES: FAD-dependent oxidoreductase [Carnobacteriaceae]API89755.1 dehydrogenase [Marinilactibacillus sp. 15R]MCI3028316.1 FAD-dependent oxidoreductase [Desemzia sp. C1]SFK11553.1 NADPH-dependent 2,4-dienoyl-CoA reductase, sulfur reductase [Marinilactibacillus piezotolerans]
MRIVIIGSVAAGTSVAAKARRNTEEAEIVVYDQGKDISYSVCGIPYQMGGEVESIDSLTPRNAEWFKKRYEVDIFTEHKVTKINHEQKTLEIKDLASGETKEDHYDVLVLATGASPFTPPPFNQNQYDNVFQVRNIQDAQDFAAFSTKQPKKALIIGAGFIGLEMTEQLVHKGLEVTVVQLEDQVMPPMDADMTFRVEEHMREKGVHLILNDTVKSIEGESSIERVTTTNGVTIETDIVILSAGIRPNTELAKEIGVEIGATRAIAVNKKMQTNLPDIYAVGDVAESFSVITGKPIYRPLGSTANKMGRIAGDVITGGNLEHRGVLGTGIFRIFDLHVGQTGLTEKEAKAEGYEVEVLYNIKPDHAEYLGGKELTIKALADKETSRILGAQVIGKGGVDKRIDVLATAITFGAKAEDLFHLDLAYAPPFATTKDPVLYTGMALDNALHRNPLITPEEILRRQENGEKMQIIDTRSKKDHEKSHVKGAVHIGLYDLRSHLENLDKNVPTVTYCNKGTTGNAAQNVLLNHGFNEVYNLSGGNKNYQSYVKMLESKSK